MIYIAKLARRLARLREGTNYLLMIASLLLLLSCAAGEPTGFSTSAVSEPEGESIVLSPRQVTLEADQRIKFFAYESDIPGSAQVTSVEWTATGGTISPDGDYTATVTGDFRVVGKKKGWYKNVPDTSTVIIVPTQPTVVEVMASPTGSTVVGGQRQQFTAQGRLSDGSTAAIGVTWTTTGGSIDAGGLFTASNVSGTYQVIALHTTTGVADTVPVTVKAVRQVTINPTTSQVSGGSILQYAARGTLEDGTTTALTSVGYSANGGSITNSGLYTSPSTAGTYRVTTTLVPPTGTTLSADAAVSVVSTATSAFSFDEDFSAYTSTDAWLGTEGAAKGWQGVYRDGGNYALDSQNAFGGSRQSIRYDFPDAARSADKCAQPRVGRELVLARPLYELWMEAYVKFSSTFHTAPDPSWGCTAAPDHKLLRGFLADQTSYSGVSYFGLKDGHFGTHWAASYPGGLQHWDVTLQEQSAPYWNNSWVQVRVHWKVATNGTGVTETWLNGKKIDGYYSGNSRVYSPINRIIFGLNLNNMVTPTQSLWWGRIRIYGSNPGW